MMAGRRNIWMASQQEQLFQLQNIYGNKWAFIASKMGWKADIIKNKFYSTLRRGHRKLNKYIVNIKKKQDPIKYRGYKAIQDIFIPKLIAVADDHYEDKYQTKSPALGLAPQIQAGLIQIACSEDQYLFGKQCQYYKEEQLLKKIMDFNKNCKRRKGKKRDDLEKCKQAKQKNLDEQGSNLSQQQGVSVENEDNVKFEEKSIKQVNEHKYIEAVESVQAYKQNNLNINILSSFAPNNIEQPRKNSNQVKKQQQCEQNPKFSLPFLETIQKKQSVSLVISSDSQFQKKAVWFKQINDSAGGQQSSMIKSSNSMSQSIWMKQRQPVWLYESNSSKQSYLKPTKVLSNYLTQPSPTPNDPFSPFSYINIMKNKNITNSQMFEEKLSIPSDDPLNNSQNFTYGSFIQQMPLFMAKTGGQFLIKSADLKQEVMQEVLLNTSANIQRQKIGLCDLQAKRNGFANEYNFSTGEQPTTTL